MKYKILDKDMYENNNGIGDYEFWGSKENDSDPYTEGYIHLEWQDSIKELERFMEETMYYDIIEEEFGYLSSLEVEVQINTKDDKLFLEISFTADI